MEYAEIPPHPLLRPFVRTYWQLRGPAAHAAPQPILPDGTTELIVHRATPFRRHLAIGASERQAPHLFVGQMQAPAIICPDGEADVVAIRFRPFGAFALTGLPQAELVDAIADVDALGLPWLTRAVAAAEEAATAKGALQVLEQALLARVAVRRVAPRDSRGIRSAVLAIDRSEGVLKIDAVARGAGVSRRGLERAFALHVGVAPKSYAQVIRLQAAAGRLATEPAAPLADVSAGAGYFDQSHMIRDFLTFAGQSPAEFRRQLGDLTTWMLGGLGVRS